MKIVIIDDEIGAREILESLLLKFHAAHTIVGKYPDLISGVEGIKEHQPDLVFLDIEMPEYAGYEIVDFFDQINFKIVFCTAYNNYAIHAFEISAIDYILKPIEIDRLAIAIDRAEQYVSIDQYQKKIGQLADQLKKSDIKISYLNKGFREYLFADDIIAMEANGAYTKVYSKNKPVVMISKNIKQFEIEFETIPQLIRIHRSWIINPSEVIKYSKSKLEVVLKENITAKISRENLRKLIDLLQ